jgi:hypothetical protein
MTRISRMGGIGCQRCQMWAPPAICHWRDASGVRHWRKCSDLGCAEPSVYIDDWSAPHLVVAIFSPGSQDYASACWPRRGQVVWPGESAPGSW